MRSRACAVTRSRSGAACRLLLPAACCPPPAAVGLLAAHCAQHVGARRVILIDSEAYRLDAAQANLPGVEVVNCSTVKTLDALK